TMAELSMSVLIKRDGLAKRGGRGKPCTNGVGWVLVRTPLYPTGKWHTAGKRAVISAGSRPRSTPWQDRRCVAHRPPTECQSSAFLAWRTSRARRDVPLPIPSTVRDEQSSPPAPPARRTLPPVR